MARMLAEVKCGVNPGTWEGVFGSLGKGCLSAEEEQSLTGNIP